MISFRQQEKTYTILFLGRLFLGLVFAFTGFTKLVEPVENFQGGIAAYEIIPYVFIPLIAHIVPWLEFFFGVFLIIGYLPRISALMLAGMSWSFVLLILMTRIVTGVLPADCGCVGEGSPIHMTPLQVLLMDIFNTVIGLKLALTPKHPFGLTAFLSQK
jgi:uncharacterized membrane protein YphA (DoxX/SURF4 family)